MPMAAIHVDLRHMGGSKGAVSGKKPFLTLAASNAQAITISARCYWPLHPAKTGFPRLMRRNGTRHL